MNIEERTEVCVFDIVDEHKLNRLYHHPIEMAEIKDLSDAYKDEFGNASFFKQTVRELSACKQLLTAWWVV
jgi:hypothetical protein